MTGTGDAEFSWRDFVVAAAQAFDQATRRVSVVAIDVLTRAETWAQLARPVLEGLGRAALEFRDAYDEGVPSGWQTLDTDQMLAVIALMADTGWCLTTTPPPDTLVALLQAPDEQARGQLLLRDEARILDDLDVELRAANDPRLAIYAAAAREAREAHAGGLFMASQALSANTVAALSHGKGPLRHRNLGAARTKLEQLRIEDAGLREIRFYAVARAVATALKNFDPTGPEPTLFNRHASGHGLSAEQYTQLNSLTGVMLACGWVREVMWLMRAADAQRRSNGTDSI